MGGGNERPQPETTSKFNRFYLVLVLYLRPFQVNSFLPAFRAAAKADRKSPAGAESRL